MMRRMSRRFATNSMNLAVLCGLWQNMFLNAEPMSPRFYAFWAINAALDQNRLRRQLDQFRASGFDGVVWHPRSYPKEPPYLGERYLAELSEVILHAKSLGLTFWLYDEDGWPSGTAGGQLLKKFPDDTQRWADLTDKKPERCLAEFERAGKTWFLAERVGRGMDYFNPDLARHFLELTHERYRTGLKPEAWEYVETIFSDEPEFGLGHAYDSLSKHDAIPWTPKLPELFRQRYGEDLLPQIPNPFFRRRRCGSSARQILGIAHGCFQRIIHHADQRLVPSARQIVHRARQRRGTSALPGANQRLVPSVLPPPRSAGD